MLDPRTTPLADLFTCDDFEAVAQATLAPAAYDYYRSGADAERTLRDNRAAFDRWQLWPRVLRDVSRVDTGIDLFGVTLPTPILVAPTAYHRMAHPDGELATAKGAAAAGTLLCVSTLATTVLEDVAAASAGPKWFQLYVHRDRGFTRSLVERAVAAGYKALALTVDTPLLGRRLRDERNRFCLPPGLTMCNLVTTALREDEPAAARDSAWAASLADWIISSFSFEDLRLKLSNSAYRRMYLSLASANSSCNFLNGSTTSSFFSAFTDERSNSSLRPRMGAFDSCTAFTDERTCSLPGHGWPRLMPVTRQTTNQPQFQTTPRSRTNAQINESRRRVPTANCRSPAAH